MSGGGDIFHSNTSENSAKIGNKRKSENIQQLGFNNPDTLAKSPAKTDKE